MHLRYFFNHLKHEKKTYLNWWNSTPAILKGFIDRVFVAGFAFKYEGKIPKGLLTGKKAAVIMSTGAPNLFYKLTNVSIKTIEFTLFK